MTLDWNAFTPWQSLAGGLLIGVAAAMLLLLNGQIAGISGIVGGMLRPARGPVGWRIAFIAGMLAAPMLYWMLVAPPHLQIDTGEAGLVTAGLLVGIGTRFGSGCTSGHGVCGVSRGSLRSIVATACFMASGFVTVFVVRHVLSLHGTL